MQSPLHLQAALASYSLRREKKSVGLFWTSQVFIFLSLPTACFVPFLWLCPCSVFLCSTHSQFASSFRPPAPAGRWGRPLLLCHVCNLNCGKAKQDWAMRKAFHKIRLSLLGLFGEECKKKGLAFSSLNGFISACRFNLCINLRHSLNVLSHFPFLSLCLLFPTPRLGFTLCLYVRFALSSQCIVLL